MCLVLVRSVCTKYMLRPVQAETSALNIALCRCSDSAPLALTWTYSEFRRVATFLSLQAST